MRVISNPPPLTTTHPIVSTDNSGKDASDSAPPNGVKKKRSFFSSNISIIPLPQPGHTIAPSSDKVLAALSAPRTVEPLSQRGAKSLRRDMSKAEKARADLIAATKPVNNINLATSSALPTQGTSSSTLKIDPSANDPKQVVNEIQEVGTHAPLPSRSNRTKSVVANSKSIEIKRVTTSKVKRQIVRSKKNRLLGAKAEDIKVRMANVRAIRSRQLAAIREAKNVAAASGTSVRSSTTRELRARPSMDKGKGKAKATDTDIEIDMISSSDDDDVNTPANGKKLKGFSGQSTSNALVSKPSGKRKGKKYMVAGLYCQDENVVSPNKLVNKVLQQRETSTSAQRKGKGKKSSLVHSASTDSLSFPPLPYDYGERHFFGQEHEFVLPYNIHQEAESGSLDGKKRPAEWQKIRSNLFPERARYVSEHKAICKCDPSSGCGENCINRIMSYLCGKDCPAGDQCTNRSLARRPRPNTKVVYTGTRGFGLVAMEDIEEGTFVIDYRGEVISMNTFFDRLRTEYKGQKNFYALAYDQDEVIDAGLRGNEARFINHGCAPNLEVRKCQNLGDGLEEFEVGMWAMRDIKKGEELFYDYNFESFGMPGSDDLRVRCQCGAPNCVGILGRQRGEKRVRESAATLKTRKPISKTNARARNAAKSAVRKGSIKLKPRRFPKASPLAQKTKPKALAIGGSMIGPSGTLKRLVRVPEGSPLARSEKLASVLASKTKESASVSEASGPSNFLPTPPGTTSTRADRYGAFSSESHDMTSKMTQPPSHSSMSLRQHWLPPTTSRTLSPAVQPHHAQGYNYQQQDIFSVTGAPLQGWAASALPTTASSRISIKRIIHSPTREPISRSKNGEKSSSSAQTRKSLPTSSRKQSNSLTATSSPAHPHRDSTPISSLGDDDPHDPDFIPEVDPQLQKPFHPGSAKSTKSQMSSRRARKSESRESNTSRMQRRTAQNDLNWVPGTAEKVEVRARGRYSVEKDDESDDSKKPRISGWAEWLRKKAGEKPRTLAQWEEERMKRRRGKVWMLNMIKEFGVVPDDSTTGEAIIPTDLQLDLKSNRGYVKKTLAKLSDQVNPPPVASGSGTRHEHETDNDKLVISQTRKSSGSTNSSDSTLTLSEGNDIALDSHLNTELSPDSKQVADGLIEHRLEYAQPEIRDHEFTLSSNQNTSYPFTPVPAPYVSTSTTTYPHSIPGAHAYTSTSKIPFYNTPTGRPDSVSVTSASGSGDHMGGSTSASKANRKKEAIKARNGAPMGWAFVPVDEATIRQEEELPSRRSKSGPRNIA